MPDETLITWELSPGHRLTKNDIIELVKNKELKGEGEWTSGTIRLKDGQKHIALLWGDDIGGEQLAKERSGENAQDMEYFTKGEDLLLEKGRWNGRAFEYTYRWSGAPERGKSLTIIADIVVKDPSSEIGGFLQQFLDRIKKPHQLAKIHKPLDNTVSAPPTVIYQSTQPAVAPQSPIIIEERVTPYSYGHYYGSGIVVGGWGWRHHHRR